MWQVKNWGNEDLRPTNVEKSEPLTPFHRTETEYWTSEEVRDWTILNYQYDTLARIPDVVKNGKRRSSREVFRNGKLDEVEYRRQLQEYVQDAYPGTNYWLDKLGHTEFTDYAVMVEYDRYALRRGSGYAVEFGFFVEESGSQAYMIDIVSNFAGMDRVGCTNCKNQEDNKVLSRGQVSLTSHLFYMAAHDKVFTDFQDALDDSQVEKFLKEHLSWSFRGADGGPLNLEDQKELCKTKIYVASVKGKRHSDGTLHYDNGTYKELFMWNGESSCRLAKSNRVARAKVNAV